jgi:hypothetical protein
MTRAKQKAAVIADILAMEPSLAPLGLSTLEQLVALRDSMKEQAAIYAAAGLVDQAAG